MSEHILSRQNTQWMQGISALMIMLMHFVMQTGNYPRFLNILGSLGVAVFLFISGFGINESYKNNGLKVFWQKRVTRVMLPCWIIFLFQLPFTESNFDFKHLLHNLLFTDSDLWFIDCILRWYLVYWLGRKFVPKYTLYILAAFGVYNIFLMQLYSEQAISFLCGFIVSEHYRNIRCMKKSSLLKICSLLWLYGSTLVLVKELNFVQQMKGTLPFNFLLLNIKMPLATFFIALPYLVPAVKRLTFINWTGNISYELYIVHYNFMPYISSYEQIPAYTSFSFVISFVFEKLNELMRKNGYFLRTFTTIVFIGICYFMLCKYIMRITEHFGWICIGYALALASCYIVIEGICKSKAKPWLARHVSRHTNATFYLLTGLFCIAALTLQYYLAPLQNNVDRWLAIEYPLRDLFDGKFQYLDNTHLVDKDSPFPIWMVVHIPFYLIGNVGLLVIFSAILFLMSIKHIYGNKSGIVAAIMTISCVCVWHEVAIRSDFIANFFLLATFINYAIHYSWNLDKKGIFTSVCCGLWLSSRLSVIFPLFIMLFPSFIKIKMKKKLTVILLSVTTLAITFVPVVLLDADSLFDTFNKQFSVQTNQSSLIDAMLFVIISITMALTWRSSRSRLFAYSAVMLILIPVVTYTHSMYTCNKWLGLYYSIYDISYIDAAIPFCIMVIASGFGSVVYEKKHNSKVLT